MEINIANAHKMMKNFDKIAEYL
jgi:hypothetical protein